MEKRKGNATFRQQLLNIKTKEPTPIKEPKKLDECFPSIIPYQQTINNNMISKFRFKGGNNKANAFQGRMAKLNTTVIPINAPPLISEYEYSIEKIGNHLDKYDGLAKKTIIFKQTIDRFFHTEKEKRPVTRQPSPTYIVEKNNYPHTIDIEQHMFRQKNIPKSLSLIRKKLNLEQFELKIPARYIEQNIIISKLK